jgi:hydroxyacylglutathione hydrolase
MTAIAPVDPFPTASSEFDVVGIPAFRDNYIWLLHRGGRAVVVDPGDAVPVEAALAHHGLQLVAILVTHHHADHQGGVAALSERGRPAVYGPAAESITGLTHPLEGGESIRIEGFGSGFEVLAVPGHTRGHLAYRSGRRLFCGDTLFGAGCGRLFEGTPAQMAASLARIATLPDDTEVFCAHEYTEMNLRFALAVEPDNAAVRARVEACREQRGRGLPTVPSTLAEEKATNPFLRCAEPAVVAAAVARGARADDPVDVFATIRAWRNEF